MSADAIVADLREALEEKDRSRVARTCSELAAAVRRGSGDLSPRDGQRVLAFLKSNRCFRELVSLGAALTRAHPDHDRIRRLYAQGLIDAGHVEASPELYDQALMLLEAMVADDDVRPAEREEAWGLLGRIHKQMFVDDPGAPEARRAASLQAALDAYGRGWRDSRNPWHGINLVALLARARRDGIAVESPLEMEPLARELLQEVEDRVDDGKADLWDQAVAMEASLALGDDDATIAWAERYVKAGLAAGRDEFEFASTLRQLKEVWALDPDGAVGRAILPLLETVVLDRGLRTTEGSGSVQLETLSLSRMRSPESFARLERVFGDDAFVTIRWLELLFDRLQAIGSVSTRSGRGVGTGFVVRARAIHEDLDDDWIFVTNSHVITDDDDVLASAPAEHRPLHPDEARITFELLFEGEPRTFGVAEVIWSSPPDDCDVTLLRLDAPFYEDGVEPYPLARHLPDPEARPRLYIAGHPGGGSLRVSMHDNHLLEFDDRRLQYRTPTNPGSSGSPVFNDEWELVGVHHAGSTEMPRLARPDEAHEANQGIRLSAIVAALAVVLSTQARERGAR